MRKQLTGLLAVATIAVASSTMAADEKWKDGVLFTQEKVASLQGHEAHSIVFGLEPGKCTGEITAVSEWLKMTEGTMVQTYPGKGDFTRNKGDEWYQANGTKVVVCNKSNKKAMLVGVQFRPSK